MSQLGTERGLYFNQNLHQQKVNQSAIRMFRIMKIIFRLKIAKLLKDVKTSVLTVLRKKKKTSSQANV